MVQWLKKFMPLQEAEVQSLVGELKILHAHSVAKKKQKVKQNSTNTQGGGGGESVTKTGNENILQRGIQQ